jgi:hypothetical protein
MNRPTLNWLVDVLAFIAFVLLTVTGTLTRYVLPPGSGRYTTLWGLDRHGWGDIHFWVAVALLAVLAIHLILHWRWIVSMARGQRTDASGARVGLGFVGLIGLLGIAAAPFFAEVERTGEPPQRKRLSPPSEISMPPPERAAPTAGVPQPQPEEARSITPVAPQTGRIDQRTQQQSTDTETETGVEAIRGSMTLREVTEQTGVPLDYLFGALSLPSGVDPDERIGRLRRQYGTGPDAVRRAVKEYHLTH